MQRMLPIAIGVGAFILWMVGWAAFYVLRARRVAEFHRRYEASLASRHENEADYQWLLRHNHEFQRLMKDADVADTTIAYAQRVALTHVATGNASAMENWTALHTDAISWTRRALVQASGVYEARFRQSLNPLHWVVVLVTLPMLAVKFIGGNPDGSLSRALTVLWWVVGAVAIIAGLIGIDLLDLTQAP
jgi:hypothetical protein